jgi:hypothetical protein
VFFFDEAHLLFDEAPKALLEKIEQVVRLIRSKGVGVYFVTQNPLDIPESVLGQLGNRVQHALRAFTPEDADNLRKTARTFPITEFYEVERALTSLGIGEELITALSPKGVPMPTVQTMMRPPRSLMAQVDPAVIAAAAAASPLTATYAADQDPESAKEILAGQMARAAEEAAGGPLEEVRDPETPAERRMRPTRAPERGVDWGKVATEGSRLARSGTFNTILRAVLGVLRGR